MLRAPQQQECLLTACRLSRAERVGGVVLSCVLKGRHPTRQHASYFGHSKSDLLTADFLFCCCSFGVLRQKDSFPARLLFYTHLFPTTHVHVERCDWWKSVKATSSGRIFYLSAGRSRLTSLLRNQSSRTVSISTILSCLARHPRPV